ncbi:equilibrative nucleobase transporter 1-like [Argopecten irradians]|uniref:equilibrative nucleobase transporter 1-like n=1 Tax=Argopecten irradians TaxID=31199 RepID=UPI0037161111
MSKLHSDCQYCITGRNVSDKFHSIPHDERLNLIFTIGVGVFLGLIFLSGQLFMIFSVKKIRMSFMVMEVAGIMCFAFTSPGNPWLPLPGIVLTGTAGQALLISNYKQVIPLLPRRSSIYVGLLNGCIDSSVISMMAVKVNILVRFEFFGANLTLQNFKI